MLDNIDEVLSKEMLINMNVLLKRGTTDEYNPRYNVGGFKVVPNIIGTVNIIKTTPPENVEQELDELLQKYKTLEKVSIKDILWFHVAFE